MSKSPITARRSLLKFAGVTGAISIIEKIFSNSALAQTWQKVATPSGSAGTWQKLTIATTTNDYPITLMDSSERIVILMRSDGLIFSCGFNPDGQLGDNTIVSRSTFVRVIGVSQAISVKAGRGQAAVLRSDGSVFTTGYGGQGGLGNNAVTGKSTFSQAIGISNATSISCGYLNMFAIRSDGLLFGTGYNNKGQLGINSTANRSTFVQALGMSNVVAVAGGGGSFVLALRSDGFVFATGDNYTGQLGVNGVGSRLTFVQCIGISNAVAIAAGYIHGVALRSDGLVFTAGENSAGQLGDNSGSAKSTFVQAIGISNAVAVSAGYYHTMALRSDGLVFTCGFDTSGQLGDNVGVSSKRTFVQALGISNAIAIAAGEYNSVALRSDGSLFVTGNDAYGQLGINSTANKSTFVQIIDPN